MTWEIDAPAELRVVANGLLRGVTDAGRGRRRWVYVERRPIPTYTMVFGAAPFAVSRHAPTISGSDTVVNEVWTFPEDSAYADSAPFRRLTAVVAKESKGFRVTLAAEKPALWAWLELDGVDARCSDNFVHLPAAGRRQILVQPGRSMTKSEFARALRVRSLYDTYTPATAAPAAKSL